MDAPELEAAPRTGRRRRLRSDKLPVWFGIPFVILGSLTFVIGVGQLRTELRLGAEGRTLQAVVVDLRTQTGEDSTTYHVHYAFVERATGREHRGSGTVGRRTFLELRIGDPVTVSYLPTEPTTNRFGTPDPQLGMVAFVMGIGALFGGAGVAMLIAAIRQRRAPSSAASVTGTPQQGALPGPPLETTDAERRRVDTFTRSPIRVVGELIVAPLLGIGMLASAWWALGNLDRDPDLLIAAVVVAFMSLFMFAGFAGGLRRGARLRLLEVGPDGIWMPETGRLPWSEIAAVRLEETLAVRRRGAARRILVAADGSELEASSPGTFPRVGIVPRDPVLAGAASDSLTRGLMEGIVGLGNASRPEIGLTLSQPSPFGVASFELQRPIAEIVASIRRFAAVVDARPTAEPTPAARPASPAPPPAGQVHVGPVPASGWLGSVSGGPLSDRELRAIDARIGQLPSAPTGLLDVTTLASADPPASVVGHLDGQLPGVIVFRRRGWTMGDFLSIVLPGREVELPPIGRVVLYGCIGVLFVTLPGLMALNTIAGAPGGATDASSALIVLVVAVVLAGVGLVSIRRARQGWPMATGDADLLEVGPEGLRTRDAGFLRWTDIASVTSRAGSSLKIEPVAGAGPPIVVPLNVFEAENEVIIDAIAHHAIVDEEE